MQNMHTSVHRCTNTQTIILNVHDQVDDCRLPPHSTETLCSGYAGSVHHAFGARLRTWGPPRSKLWWQGVQTPRVPKVSAVGAARGQHHKL